MIASDRQWTVFDKYTYEKKKQTDYSYRTGDTPLSQNRIDRRLICQKGIALAFFSAFEAPDSEYGTALMLPVQADLTDASGVLAVFLRSAAEA